MNLKIPHKSRINKVDLPQVLYELYSSGFTGTLKLSRGDQFIHVHFSSGAIDGVKSNTSGENIVKLLLSKGVVKKEDMYGCMQYSEKSGCTIQKALVEKGIIEKDVLVKFLTYIQRTILMDSFKWKDASYEISADTSDKVNDDLEVRTHPIEIIFHGIRQSPDLAVIAKQFQDMKNVPIFRTNLFDSFVERFNEAFSGGPLICKFIDGEKNLKTLIDMKVAGLIDILSQIYALWVTKMISFGKPEETIESKVLTVDEDFGIRFSPEEIKIREEIFRDYERIKDADYFSVLGVNKDSPENEIKRAYFELAKKYHSDVYSGYNLGSARKKLEEIFSRVSIAYETLTDEQKKREYLIYLDRASKGLPTDPQAVLEAEGFFKEGIKLLRMGNYKGAEELFERSVKKNPKEAEYLIYYGWSIFRNNPDRKRECLEMIQKGLEIDRNVAMAYVFLGYVALSDKNEQLAEKNFQKALQIDSGCKEAIQQLRILKMRRQKKPSGLLSKLRKKKT